MSANEKAKRLIEEKMAAGMSRESAAAAVFKADPQLRQDMIIEANAALGRTDRPRRPAA